MSHLPDRISFDQVIPWLASAYGSQDALEDAVLADLSEELYETPDWMLLEEAVESGHLHPEEIEAEFGAFFRDELSKVSSVALHRVDRVFLQAAALGDASSLWILGLRLVRAGTISEHESEAEELEEDGLFLIVEAAEAGEPRAQWMLGERFSRMEGGLEECIRLFGMAAAQGFEEASARLLELFEGRDSFVRPATEKKWLRRFANAGVVEAQFDIANERYLQEDLKAAFAWMLHAAKAGHQPAQQRLAFFYEVGEGCSRDPQRADYWRNHPAGSDDATVLTPDDDEVLEKSVLHAPETINDAQQEEMELDAEIDEAEADEEPDDFVEMTDTASSPQEDFQQDDEQDDERDDEHEDELELPEDEERHPKEPQRESTDHSEMPELPASTAQNRGGLLSRFRSGLSSVLRRLADRISSK